MSHTGTTRLWDYVMSFLFDWFRRHGTSITLFKLLWNKVIEHVKMERGRRVQIKHLWFQILPLAFVVVSTVVWLVLGASQLWRSREQTYRQAWRFFPGAWLIQRELHPVTLVQVIGPGTPYPHRTSQRYAGIISVSVVIRSAGGWVVCLCLLLLFVTVCFTHVVGWL